MSIRRTIPEHRDLRSELLDLTHVFKIPVIEANPTLGFHLFDQSNHFGDAIHFGLNRKSSLALLLDFTNQIRQRGNVLGRTILKRELISLSMFGRDIDRAKLRIG